MAQTSEGTEVPNVVHNSNNSNWRTPGAADGEIVCGVGNDCVMFPNTVVISSVPQQQGNEIVEYSFPEQDFLDIQVTEEEVISETWDNGQPLDDER
jgi:hypothetical protein